jgi:hypothetical protein
VSAIGLLSQSGQLAIVDNKEEESLSDFLIHKSLELCWTSNELDPLGNELEPDGTPYDWSQERRQIIKAKIDAAIAQLYGLSRDDFAYILDRFDILKKREKEEYGHYRRKEECLHEFDSLNVYRRND